MTTHAIDRDAAPAERIELFRIDTPSMRAFHVTWMAFFLCFFAWFGLAPLMPVIRDELQLTRQQVGWCLIGSVAMTVFARLLIGRLCDRYGPRLTYAWLLWLGALPVIGAAFAHDFASFFVARLLIGSIGASFVITQYHTSKMFAPNCVGTANATAAGWGNLGGGVTQMAMPLLFAAFTGGLGLSAAFGWRACMVVAGLVCATAGCVYYWFTQDTPQGNFADLRAAQLLAPSKQSGSFWTAARNYRVWSLALIYACCFGLELTLDNVAVLYFSDVFHLDIYRAGLIAGGFGMMNLFARALGGIVSDRWAREWGLPGRSRWLFVAIFGEGVMLLVFSQMTSLPLAVAALLGLGLFIKMSNGATYALVPFVNRSALGSVAGIVGAGGNVGAVAAGFLFQSGLSWPTTFWLLGLLVSSCSALALLGSYSQEPAAEPALAPAPADAAVAPAVS
uniref:MFS transporter n=1 Tax=Schlesneria paludicola TaxID=360056 RepID=A0A7C2JX13_9PLAN